MTVTEDATTWPEFLTIAEVAAILRVSKMTVYRMVHDGRLAAIRAGRGFRIYSRPPRVPSQGQSLEEYLKDSGVTARVKAGEPAGA